MACRQNRGTKKRPFYSLSIHGSCAYFCSWHWLHVSRAWHRTSYMFSRTWHRLNVIPRLAPLHVFSHLAPVACFTAFGTGCMFSHTWHRLNVSRAWHRLNISRVWHWLNVSRVWHRLHVSRAWHRLHVSRVCHRWHLLASSSGPGCSKQG